MNAPIPGGVSIESLRDPAAYPHEVEVPVQVNGPATLQAVLDALEARYPVLRGTLRDHGTLRRRPFVRFFACEQDLSLELPDAPLPDEVETLRAAIATSAA